VIVAAALLVLATLVAMASGRIPAVLALASGLAVAGLLGIAPPEALFSGLSNGGVITIAGMLVIAKGIVQTGVIARVTRRLLATTRTARQALGRLMVPVGVASALMNTTPIVAMLIPAAKQLEQTRRVPAREVLLPIAHVTTLAGAMTLIGTSSNLLIAGIAGQRGVEMSMFSFTSVALPVALVGWAVIYLTAPLLLKTPPRTTRAERDWRVEIPVSPRALARGRTGAQLGLLRTQLFELQAHQRWGEPLEDGTPIEVGDVLVFAATESGVRALWGNPHLGLAPHRLYEISIRTEAPTPVSEFEGEDGGLHVIAATTAKPFRQTRLHAGDTCFVSADAVESLAGHEAVALWHDAASRAPQPRKTWIALGILAGVIVAASFGLAPVELAAMTGAVLMVLTGVITPGSAARALDWNVLFILAGSVGLGAVVVESGLADKLAEAIRTLAHGNLLLIVVVFVVTTTIMTNLVTNAAAASILTPVALSIAAEEHLDPVVLLALIGTCICFTFLNPFSHQSNLMVMRPGGYTNASFARFGGPLICACLISACGVGYVLLRA
jgi:di/tricarboxylate transporter